MSSEEAIPDFWSVVPAGGSGTRLWPLSRRSAPKFLQDLTGSGRSLLQDTAARLTPLSQDRLVVVTGILHADAVREQLPELAEDRLLVEPSPRDSMPAIALAAATIERIDPDAVLGSFAADHVIGQPETFRRCVREAVQVARAGALVTLGIQPSYPSTGFGYIEVGGPWRVDGAPSAHRVDTFVEKPDRATAERYLAGGRHRWNAGIFVVRAAVLLEMLGTWHPDLVEGARLIAAEPRRIQDVWPSMTKIAIDHAVAEPAAAAGKVAVIPGDFPWDDVGDFASLATLLEESGDHPGLRILGPRDQVISQDSSGVVAAHAGRTVVTLGVPDVVVIDTVDALLVTTRERVQDVKGIVETLQRIGREDLT
ncbi:mannose-1-phosphate guanylyltransferase [Ornithinicoccus hortensis]|uniref:Mannose-1-phosphate guanylyltransferase n=1 Tax=Ornithinicoccus hortensis TaxID=82346 RepID=A0A542YQ57_9MICO|nr:mannose-1-phosphate guanylyltransferase [Ornithinicoccus hortensis]TQL50243.1 mannose-1-phosphate guanylyltransferase [Ornithinicoccus hortensis]